MPHVTNHSTLIRVSKNDRRPVLAPFQNGVPAVQPESAPRPLRQPAVAFIAIVHQNRPYLAFKKLKVLRIRVNQIHTNNKANGKRFGQKLQSTKNDATNLTLTSIKELQDTVLLEKKGGC